MEAFVKGCCHYPAYPIASPSTTSTTPSARTIPPKRSDCYPDLVHLTIGLFAIRIAFDFAGAFYPLEKRLFRFLALPVTRSDFHDVGWFKLMSCSGITFFTVAAGFHEMLLAVPLPDIRSILDQTAVTPWSGMPSEASRCLLVIVAMTIWRRLQRFIWRKDIGRQVT